LLIFDYQSYPSKFEIMTNIFTCQILESMRNYLLLLPLFLLIACGPSAEQLSEQARIDSVKMDQIEKQTSAASPSNESSADSIANMMAFPKARDTSHKFIRTAEAKFKVKEVTKASYKIEDIAAKYKGFITLSLLRSDLQNTSQVDIQRDSLTEVHLYSVYNDMELRVPNQNLDSFLREISPLIVFLDYRNIKAEDITLALKQMERQNKRLEKFEKRMTKAVDKSNQDLHQTTHAEDAILNRQSQADANAAQQASLLDQYNYSTVKLYVYQNNVIRRERVANTNIWQQEEPGFFSRMGKAFMRGITIVSEILIFLTNLWLFALVVLIAFYLIRKWLKYRKIQKENEQEIK
jgi:hypothetical protein